MKRITRIEPSKSTSVKKLRVAAYARVSTDSDEQAVSLEAQKLHYERYIRSRKDWEFAGLYFDEGISGTKIAKREGMLRMLEDCDRGLIDYIVVKSISRFSRNTVDSVETIRKLSAKGIYIYFEKEKIDTAGMESELMLSILSSLAESESYSNSQNNKWAAQKRFQAGTFKISYPPYGYDNIDGKMVVNREQAEVVRKIFDYFLSGDSASAVAKRLNEEGIPSKKGGQWCTGTIYKMIRNEKYKGDAIFQKTYTDDMYNRHVNYGEYIRYELPDHHEPIVSREIFDAANALMDMNGREKGISGDKFRYTNHYAMSGKVFCGECGGRCKRVITMGYPGFGCVTHLKKATACSQKAVPETYVKAAFVTMMNKLTWGRDRVLVPFSRMMQEEGCINGHAGIEELDMLLDEIRERKQQIKQFFARGLLDPVIYAEENNALADKEARLRSEKASTTADSGEEKDRREALKKLLHYTAGGRQITEFDDDLFTEHVDHVIIYGRTEIGFAMKCGPVFRERI